MKNLLTLLLLSCLVTIGYAQRTLTGTVTDVGGEPLIGVNIVIQGTSTGTTTDLDGSFSLDVPDQGAVLQVSYIGFQTTTIEVGESSEINITLKTDAQVLG